MKMRIRWTVALAGLIVALIVVAAVAANRGDTTTCPPGQHPVEARVGNDVSHYGKPPPKGYYYDDRASGGGPASSVQAGRHSVTTRGAGAHEAACG